MTIQVSHYYVALCMCTVVQINAIWPQLVILMLFQIHSFLSYCVWCIYTSCYMTQILFSLCYNLVWVLPNSTVRKLICLITSTFVEKEVLDLMMHAISSVVFCVSFVRETMCHTKGSYVDGMNGPLDDVDIISCVHICNVVKRSSSFRAYVLDSLSPCRISILNHCTVQRLCISLTFFYDARWCLFVDVFCGYESGLGWIDI